jgi:pimeloyl-ACP methyl ester carboxylesterase
MNESRPAGVIARCVLTVAAACLVGDLARAQAPAPQSPVNGVDYRFKRLVTKRFVDDGVDQGWIKLVSYVYQPLEGRGDVAIVLHGSTGGMASSPNEPLDVRDFPVDFLLGRGLTVVVPLRRGRAESTGAYVEECPYHPGRCSLADSRAMADEALTDALASTEAVFDDIQEKLTPREGKVVLWGLSRGGFLALAFAARRPSQVRGVVAVSAGWLSIADPWPADENAARLEFHRARLAADGSRFDGPTLWVYADRDPFYRDAVTRQFFEAWKSAGGAGRYLFIAEHPGATGHTPAMRLWEADAIRFLRKFGL